MSAAPLLGLLLCALLSLLSLLPAHTAAAVSAPTSQRLRVHLVTHSHTDAGWLKTVDQYFSGLNRSIAFGHVHAILDSVLLALSQNPQRRFSYGEQAFFQRWMDTLSPSQLQQLRAVVASGQLEFINGGWCMHDEASTHYTDMVDQTALGHRFIRDQFGEAANPRAGWQIGQQSHCQSMQRTERDATQQCTTRHTATDTSRSVAVLLAALCVFA